MTPHRPLDETTRVLVQGITGRIGSVQTRWMLDYGTNVVAGVTPEKAARLSRVFPYSIPSPKRSGKTGAEASVFSCRRRLSGTAFFENVDAGVGFIVVVPEHIPVRDVMEMRAFARGRDVFALGPTTPGILVPGRAKMGIMPGALFAPGKIGIISRSGTLAYEMAGLLTESASARAW
jgi:succinyl-CoA synthetase alpha subunit